MRAVAQKAQAIAHPTWLERQSVTRPALGIITLSMASESAIGTSNYQGIESGMLPLTRSIGLNLSLSF